MSLLAGAPLYHRSRGGKTAFDTLVYEADVAAEPRHGPRLVDNPRYAQNAHLWLELLQFRKRIDGSRGVTEIWTGMRQRNFDMPVEGPIADALWSTFLTLGFAGHQDLLEELYTHALHLRDTHGLQRATLYQSFVGGCLRKTPIRAVKWHQRLSDDRMSPNNPAAIVIEHVNHSNSRKDAWIQFKRIYRMSHASGLYDICMPSICEHCDIDVALMWHRFLIVHDDLPSSVLRSSVAIERLFEYSRSRKSTSSFPSTLTETERSALEEVHLSEQEPPLFSRQNMNTLVGDVHGIRQKKIGDAFCARLFATNAFSIDLIISGLRLLGLELIGSLALREIGARVQSLQEYIDAVRAIESAGIAVEQTIFSRALMKFAEQGENDFFHVLVRSDRHPDTYGNPELQRELISSFVAAGDMVEAYTTLAVLTIDHADPDAFSWNMLLGVHVQRNDRPRVLQLLHEMRSRGISVSDESLGQIYRIMLRPRAPSKRPTTEYHVEKETHPDDLDFVTNIFLSLLRSGQYIQPSRWRDIIRRYGMTNRITSLERLIIWLAAYYSGRLRSVDTTSPADLSGLQTSSAKLSDTHTLPENLDSFHPSHPFSTIFSVDMLRAVIAWGFRSAVPPMRQENRLVSPLFEPVYSGSHLGPLNWARGIKLIRKLRDHYGLSVNYRCLRGLRREVRMRLWILYGPGLSRVKLNRIAKSGNKLYLYQYVQGILKVWGDERRPFFHLPIGALEQGLAGEARIYRAVFGEYRRIGRAARNRHEVVRFGRARRRL